MRDGASRGMCAGGARALLFGLWWTVAVNRGDGGAEASQCLFATLLGPIVVGPRAEEVVPLAD